MAPLQKFISVAAIATLAGQLIFLVNLFWSMRKGPVAAANPWDCCTLEWTLASPVPVEGFGKQRLEINNGPYEYKANGAEKDFVMQDSPAS
jgi:cytochrome c oxidase subunit 1